MASDRRSRVYSFAPSPPPPPPPARPARQPAPLGGLLTLGCLGIVLGLLLGACGFAAILTVGAGGTALPTPPEADTTRPDIAISIREQYFGDLLAQSLPEDWARELKIDVKPDNRIETRGRVSTSIFGQKVEGDMAATIVLQARDGKLQVEMEEIEVMGFSIGGIGEGFTKKLLGDINNLINDQVKAGLGEGAYIMKVTTDDRTLAIDVRFQP